MAPMLGQALPVEAVLNAPAVAVLSLIALVLVGLLGWVLRALVSARKPEGDEALSDRVVKAIALIEHEQIDLPKNWREFVDGRIEHKRANRRASLIAYVHLLERGQQATVIRMLKEEAEEE
jgi:hypothetical protein